MSGRRIAAAVPLAWAVLAGGAAAETLEDPTRPHATVAVVADAAPATADAVWRLSMVRVSGAVRSAVLNGTLVREGDTLGGATVTRIVPGSVVIDEGGRHTVVALAGEPLKRPVEPGARTRTPE